MNRLRFASSKNSNPNKNRRLRADYMRKHPLCEVCSVEGRETPADDPHHIFGGHARADELTNILAVCRPCHNWIDRTPIEGRVLSLFAKHASGWLDLFTLSWLWGSVKANKPRSVGAWLSHPNQVKRCEGTRFEPMRRELVMVDTLCEAIDVTTCGHCETVDVELYDDETTQPIPRQFVTPRDGRATFVRRVGDLLTYELD